MHALAGSLYLSPGMQISIPRQFRRAHQERIGTAQIELEHCRREMDQLAMHCDISRERSTELHDLRLVSLSVTLFLSLPLSSSFFWPSVKSTCLGSGRPHQSDQGGGGLFADRLDTGPPRADLMRSGGFAEGLPGSLGPLPVELEQAAVRSLETDSGLGLGLGRVVVMRSPSSRR